MASKPLARGGLTPGKLGLIITLSVLLLVVIVVQFGSGSKLRRKTARPRRLATAKKAENSEANDEPKAAAKTVDRQWPDYQVNDVVAYNPFTLPGKLRPQEVAPKTAEGRISASVSVERPDADALRLRQTEFIASLREQGVDMVLMTPAGTVARVGPSSFRVGDVVEGLIVTEINSSGIVFEPESRSGGDDVRAAQPAGVQTPQP